MLMRQRLTSVITGTGITDLVAARNACSCFVCEERHGLIASTVRLDVVFVTSTFSDARDLVRDGWGPSVSGGGLFDF